VDIAAWLQELGLERYEQAFRENEIDAEILPKLTADDLKEIGVAAVGHRRKLLEAIAALAEPAQQAEPSAPAEAVPAAQPAEAERRPLTVMFCDLVDSTALSTKLDPEDLQDLIRTYRERCTALILEYGGFVAKYMGDGILVYFGYPKALERNAERAVRTGLAIVEAMAELSQSLGSEEGIDIAVRIGIATGLVVVGEIVGEGLAQERTVIGEAPNVAARLQSVAPRNGIVIGALTKEIAGDAFVYEDLGAHELKGITGLVKTWSVVGLAEEAEEESENEAAAAVGRVPLVGRDEEIGLLRRAWQQTKDEGRGRVVVLVGEPGIGKSALVETLRAQVREEGLARVAFRCSPFHGGSALWPVIEHLRHLLRWQPEDDPEARLDKLEMALAGTGLAAAEAVALFATLLSLPLPEGRHPPLDLSPEQLKQQTQDALIAWTLEDAERKPLLEVWEDLHWADPSTMELLGLLVEQVPTVPLLIVLTFRPEFQPPWPSRSHVTPITLGRLERPQIEAMVTGLAGGKTLPAEVVEHIVAKTDGVPLYVEELTKAILVSDILRAEAGRYVLTGPLAAVSIPATLQESLMARLDRLPTVREVAQLGAVLGREFAYEMLRALGVIAEPSLSDGLGRLVEAELLYQRGRPPKARYVFKHALVQDAAYQSLLKRTRQHYHRQVAELLESSFPEVVEAQPELIAHHYAEAGSASEAVSYLQRAGEKAVQRSANVEAIAQLAKGLEVVGGMPDGAERAHRELSLLTTMGPALIATKGYAAPEVEPAYRRAMALCEQLGDPARRFAALHGLWFFHFIQGDLASASSLAEQLADMAKGQEDSDLELAAHRALGYTQNCLGDLEAARFHLERVVTCYDPAVHGDYTFRHGGADPGAGSMCMSALVDWVLGHVDRAKGRYEDGLALARELGHPFSEVWALTSAAILHQLRGEPEATREHAEAAGAIARERGFAVYVGWTTVLQGWALGGREASADAVAEIRRGLDASWTTGAGLFTPYWLSLLASTHARLGQPQEGLAAVAEALEVTARTGERLFESDLRQLQGQLLMALDAVNQVEAANCFRHSLEIARRQGAKAWELRAATGLARLWRDQCNRAEAHDLLAPVYGWFTEGFDTHDLKDAKALLDELA
jgi:class 3 adenylate cyclase/predicted ATPase